MLLKFTKMHGLGNDFVVLDLISQRFSPRPRHARALADRRRGIGCDQLLVVEPPGNPEADFRYRVFNRDGGEVAQCGNGARCLARFVRDRKLTGKRRLRFETRAGTLELRVLEDGQVRVGMGVPEFEPARIPLRRSRRATLYPLRVDGRELRVAALAIGNPHAVLGVADAESAPVAQLGPALESHPDFPERVNAGFMQVLSRAELRLRVFERGAGETLACGSGACAAVVAGRLQGLLDERVTVRLNGGPLEVEWAGEGQPVMMTGPATRVYEGEIEL